MEYELVNGRLTVRMPYELDDHATKQLKEEIDCMIDARWIRTLIFDFQDTCFMDSAGIGMILGRYKKLNFAGGRVHVIHVNERIWQMMRLAGLYKVVQLEMGGVTVE